MTISVTPNATNLYGRGSESKSDAKKHKITVRARGFMCNGLQHNVRSKSETQERIGNGFECAAERAEPPNLALRLRWAVGLRKSHSPGDIIALPKLIEP
jgi:hypothetical protein